MFQVRKAEVNDQEAVWQILKSIIERGDTFTFYPDWSKEEMLAYWFDESKHTYVVLDEDKIVGTFYIQDNQLGLGSHIANAGYGVASNSRGKGIGRKMGEFSLQEAKRLGYTAMQFNLVVKSNETAVKLWKDLGFDIIGEIPRAFKHTTRGYTNAYIMYKAL